MNSPSPQANHPALTPIRPKPSSLDSRGADAYGEDRAVAVRAHERFSAHVEVSLQSDHNFYTGFTENISSGGLFISTRELLPIGTVFQLQMSLPTMPDCRIDCEVRWQRLEQLDNPESVPGMGVRFINLDEQTSRAMNDFIRLRDTLFYDDE